MGTGKLFRRSAIGLILAVVMVLGTMSGIFPGSGIDARAEGGFELYVGGTLVYEYGKEGDGWKFERIGDNNVLTLNGFSYTGKGGDYHSGIYYKCSSEDNPLSIVVNGDNSINIENSVDEDGKGYSSYGIYTEFAEGISNNLLSIDVSGELNIGFVEPSGNPEELNAFHTVNTSCLKTGDGIISATGGAGQKSYGVYMDNSQLNVTAGQLIGQGSVSTESESCGIKCDTISVVQGNIYGKAPLENGTRESCGIKNRSIRVYSGATLIAEGNKAIWDCTSSESSIAADSNNVLVIKGGENESSSFKYGVIEDVDDCNWVELAATAQLETQKVTPPEAISDLVYTGEAQKLVTAASVAEGEGNTEEGSIKYRIGPDGEWSTEIPEKTDAGIYKIYYMVEGNEEYNEFICPGADYPEKEYPGAPAVIVEIAKGEATAPTGLTAIYEQKLSDIELPEGWSWVDPDQSVGKVGTNSFYANYEGDENHKPAENVEVSVEVSPADFDDDSINASGYKGDYDGKPHGITVTVDKEKYPGAVVTYSDKEDGDYSENPVTFTDFTGGAKKVYYKVSAECYNDKKGSEEVDIYKAKYRKFTDDEKPTARSGADTVYTGEEIQLINLPNKELEEFEIYYMVIKKGETDGTPWEKNIPYKTDPGTYTVKSMYTSKNYVEVHIDDIIVEITPVDKTELKNTVEDAEKFYEKIKDEEELIDIAQALKEAIESADKVASNDTALASEVAAALSDIKSALASAEADSKDVLDRKAAEEVKNKINQLIIEPTLTDEEKQAVKNAIDSYNALTDDQKKLVNEDADVMDMLDKAEKAFMETEKAAHKTQADKMALDGDSDVCKKLISDAKSAIDALAYDKNKTSDQNVAAIDAVISKLGNDLNNQRAADKKAADKKDEADTEAANAATDIINDVPGAEGISLEDKPLVEKARAAYDALTEAQKVKVPADALQRLIAAEKAIMALEQSGKQISGVGTISNDGKTLTDLDGTKYKVSGKLTNKQLKKGVNVADKKSSGKYKITKVTKKSGKVSGGTVTYMKPYNINSKSINIKKTVKIAGATFKVTAISKNACKNLKKATKVTIGANVTSIGASAFNGCKNVKLVTIKTSKLKSIGSNAFKNTNKSVKFKVPKKNLKKYKKMIKKAKAPKKAKVVK